MKAINRNIKSIFLVITFIILFFSISNAQSYLQYFNDDELWEKGYTAYQNNDYAAASLHLYAYLQRHPEILDDPDPMKNMDFVLVLSHITSYLEVAIEMKGDDVCGRDFRRLDNNYYEKAPPLSKNPIGITKSKKPPIKKDRRTRVKVKPKSKDARPIARSELSVTQYKLNPDPAIKGQPTKISFAIENTGTKDAHSFNVEWWASSQDQVATKTFSNNHLRIGQKKKIEFIHTWPEGLYQSVETKILIDPQGKIAENNRRDNGIYRTISFVKDQRTQASDCDLRVSRYQWNPDPVIRGKDVDIMFDIVNNGPGVAEQFNVYWYANPSDRDPSQIWQVQSIAPGSRKSFDFKYQLPVTIGSQLQFKIVIDPDKWLSDSNEANNIKLLQVKVQ